MSPVGAVVGAFILVLLEPLHVAHDGGRPWCGVKEQHVEGEAHGVRRVAQQASQVHESVVAEAAGQCWFVGLVHGLLVGDVSSGGQGAPHCTAVYVYVGCLKGRVGGVSEAAPIAASIQELGECV